MKVPKIVVPVLVVVMLAGGYVLRHAFTQPTTSTAFDSSAEAEATLVCVVEGLKCRGTAAFFTKLFENTTGIVSLETFASEHRAVFTYDPSVIDSDQIRAVIEQKVPLRDGTSSQVFRCISIEPGA